MSLRKRISAFLAPPQPSAPLVEEPPQAPEETLVKLHDFRKDGEFDYQGYRAVQLLKAKADKGDVWADEKTLDLIADHAREKIPEISFVLCHGSKSGMESKYLSGKLDCEGLGTDIAPPEHATGVEEWDFHDERDDWKGRASLIYTNAFDHSYDPKKALDCWVEQLAPGGLIVIEHTMLHGPQGASKSDPFGAHPMILPYLILEWGRGRYCVQEIIVAPHKKPHWKPVDGTREDTDLDIWLFVIGRTGVSSGT